MANTAELVFIPAPGLGHIMSTIEVAKLFVNRDQRLSITVLVIKPPSSSSGSAITAYFESLAKNAINRVTFVELPQDDAPPMHDPKSFVASFNEYIESHCKHVRKVVAELLSQPGSGRLAGQPPASVVLLCFGSMGSFDEVQVKEIARALEQSGHRFVWSLRRPPSNGTTKVPSDYEDPGVVLPEGFLERTNGVGKVIGWAPQVALLAHSAVGGFVSHCGWNSLLESIWFGVPVATWPVYAEQQMNAFEMVVELGLSVEIKCDYIKNLFDPKAKTPIVSAEVIENGIRRVMEDKEVRRKAKEMSEKSQAAVAEGGSSYAAVGNLIQDFISNIS
ncbi:putative anthocyanidin 3-O-glucosyltransferase [Helianthus annuus]|nr:putative anthocyanidin 3-O-glucosyltransferase [Helianthus annuus]KAJ0609863.1 putative anthocyanidin 3-O-glucosyltransferase [Helianthus annuus]